MKPLVDRNGNGLGAVIAWLLVLAFALAYGTEVARSAGAWLHQFSAHADLDAMLKAFLASPTARGADL